MDQERTRCPSGDCPLNIPDYLETDSAVLLPLYRTPAHSHVGHSNLRLWFRYFSASLWGTAACFTAQPLTVPPCTKQVLSVHL